MKTILNNIDFENNKLLAKYIIPFLIGLDTLTVIGGVLLQEWLSTAGFLFCTAYIICNLIMQVQIKVPKNYAVFLFIYTLGMAVYAAYMLWTHDWVNGVIYSLLVITNLIVLKFRINENKEEDEEEEKHVDF
ncbi:hypothetical protein MARVELLAND_165 [Bacillus phage vB_BspM_MarvelLand]|nr:hypothetical protein MARVELLAND_165 [Bacillus phage vB_BspM_MarvelLand]